MVQELTQKIMVELTPQDAEKFKVFLQHYEVFDKLLKSKVFDVKATHVQLHFDQNSKLRLIWIPLKFD